jgi:hypothetical protein
VFSRFVHPMAQPLVRFGRRPRVLL